MKDHLGLSLPSYDGPHDVGTLTLELALPNLYSNYKLSSPMRKINSNGQPILELNNSLVTIFYPTRKPNKFGSFKSIFNLILAKSKKEPRLGWITLAQIQGYLKFASITSWKRWFILPLALLALGPTKLPTRGGAPIYLKKTTEHQLKEDSNDCNDQKEDTNNCDHLKEPYKLIIFSHGLTGNRTCYSQLCGNLAAQGYVVAALEHRDGTSSHSISNSLVEGKIKSKEIPYVDMCDVTEETRPENYLSARAYQLELRTIELLACFKLLSQFSNSGSTSSENWKLMRDSNLRIHGSAGWAGDDGLNWNDRQWADFANSVQWDRDVTIAGHSFGAATVIAAAKHENRPMGWTRFVLYDPWVETFNYVSEKFMKELKNELTSEKFPYLIINSPAFTDWKDHFEQLKELVINVKDQDQSGEEPSKNSAACCLITTLGGIIHSSFSDLPILTEWIWKKIKNLKLDSQKAIKMITSLTIEFIEFPIGETSQQNSTVTPETEEAIKQKLKHGNKLESFIHQHNLIVKDKRKQPSLEEGEQEYDNLFQNLNSSDSLQPGTFFIHFKKFFS